MSKGKTIGERIDDIEKAVNSLNALSERLWKLENPPKYKYGDTGYMPLFGKEHPVKILEAKFAKTDFSLINVTKFHWVYLVDITGIGVATYPEDQIHL